MRCDVCGDVATIVLAVGCLAVAYCDLCYEEHTGRLTDVVLWDLYAEECCQ